MPRKKSQPEKLEPTPDRQLEHKSGWCMTNHHDNCPYQFSFGKCGCDCHKQTKKSSKAKESSSEKEDPVNDPRPWRK